LSTYKSDLINGTVTQIKYSCLFTLVSSISFGMELADALWKPHDDFYPFRMLMWAAMCALFFLASRGALKNFTYTVELAEADVTRVKARKVLLAIFGAALNSFCFAISAIAAKQSGGLYNVAAVVLGVLPLFFGFLMYRGIKRLAPHS